MFPSQMLCIVAVLLAISVLARETPLFLLTLSLLIAASVSRLWERYCLTRVEYRRRFSRHRVFYGEEVDLEIETVNRKLLPLSWIEIEDEVPRDLPPVQGRLHRSHKPKRALLVNLLALRPFERIRRHYTFPCLIRGEHLFGPVVLRSGDLFGFASCEQTVDLVDALVVCPRVVPLAQLGLPARNPLGDVRAQSRLFEDMSRIAGAREYRPGDGLRRIHWPASAKAQQLQAKVYEATTSHQLAVFLNLSTNEYSHWDGVHDPDVVEMSITVAASISCWGLEQGYQVGLYTNGMHRGSTGHAVVKAGRDTGQLERILVALGRLQPISAISFEELLLQEAGRLPFGATLVIVTAALRPPADTALMALRGRGHALTAILTGRRGDGASPEGVVVRRVGPPEAWREMDAISPLTGSAAHVAVPYI